MSLETQKSKQSDFFKALKPSKESVYFLVFIFLIFSILFYVNDLLAEESCVCANIQCPSCEAEVNIEFYTQKCGVNDSKVKSCKKPVCEPVAEQDKCLAKLLNSKNKNTSVDSETKRQPASSLEMDEAKIVAFAQAVFGKPRVRHLNGIEEVLVDQSKIHIGDRIETQENEQLRIEFVPVDASAANAQNDIVHIHPKTIFLIQDYLNQQKAKKKSLMQLLGGKVRVSVKPKPESFKGAQFEVRTRTAVAGVRGTDFVLSYDAEHESSTLDTLSGAVELMPKLSELDEPEPGVLIGAGHEGRVELDKKVPMLKLVRRLSPAELKALKESTLVKDVNLIQEEQSKNLKLNEKICHEPEASFQQCSWSCVGVSSKDKFCNTERPGVQCIQKTCGAGGKWVNPSVLPASRSEYCEPHTVKVGECIEP